MKRRSKVWNYKSLPNHLKSYSRNTIHVTNELDTIYDYITEGIILGSKVNWYEHGEKSSKYFFNLEKRNKALKGFCFKRDNKYGPR